MYVYLRIKEGWANGWIDGRLEVCTYLQQKSDK